MADLNKNFDNQIIASSVDEGDFSEQRLGSDFQGDIRATASFNPVNFNNIHQQNKDNFMENIEESPIIQIHFSIGNENISHDINQYSLRGSQMQISQHQKISQNGSIKNQINSTYKQNNNRSSSGDAKLQKLKNLGPASNLQKSFQSNQKDGPQKVQNVGSGYNYSLVQKNYQKSQLKPNGLQKKISSDSQRQSQIQKLEMPLSQSSGSSQKVVPPPPSQRNIKNYIQENEVKYITSIQQLNEVEQKTDMQTIQSKTLGQELFYSLKQVDILKKQFKKQPALEQPIQAKIQKSQQNIQNPQTFLKPATSNNQKNTNYIFQGQPNIINTTVSPKLNINSNSTNHVLNRYFGSSPKQKIQKIQQSQSSQQNINTGPILQRFSSRTSKELSQSNSTPQLTQNTQLSKILDNARQYRPSQIQNSSTNFSSINQIKYVPIINTPNSPKNQFIEKPQSIATPYNNFKQQNIHEQRYVSQNVLQKLVQPKIFHQLSKSPSSPLIFQTIQRHLISKQQQQQLIQRQSHLFAKAIPQVDKESLSFGSCDSKTKPPVYFTFNKNPSQTQPCNPTTPQNKNLYEQIWQSRVKKLEVQLNKYQQYIIKIQQQNKMLKQELIKFINVDNSNKQYVQLIKNQQLIIRELQSELNKKKISQNVSKPDNDQQYIILINTLEAKIKQLQRNSNPNQQSQRNYTQIIQKQRILIQNIQNNFKQQTKNSTYRQNQLKSILHNQQSIINTLEQQTKRIRTDSGQINKQRQKQLLKQIEQKNVNITQLQFQITKKQEKINQLREQLDFNNKQVLTLKQYRRANQRTIQDKLEQKLALIQQQLRNKSVDSIYHQSSRNQNHQQIQQLMEENDRLVQQLRKRQQQKRKIQQQLINQQENIRRIVMEKQSQIRLFDSKIKLLEQEHKRKLNDKDKIIKQLQEKIQNLNIRTKQNINSPRSNHNIQSFEILSPSNNSNSEIRNLKQKLSIKQQELSQVLRQRQNTEKKYQILQTNFNSIDQQNAKNVQELMNLKRQLSNYASFQSEIKTLTQTINKKNQQIIELKSVSFQKGQLKIQFQSVKNQRNNLKMTIQTKNQQISRLKLAMGEIQNRMRQTKQRQTMFPSSNQSLAEELQAMYESVKKKQAQLIKIKQANQLLQTDIHELQYELQRAKSKIVLLEKNVVHQKQQIVNATLQYDNRIKDLQNKAKILQQSQRNSKTSFTLQLQNMENALKDKDQTLRKLQSQNKIFKNKFKNHESKTQEYDTQIQNLNIKIKQTQASKQQMKKQIQTLQAVNLANMNTKKLYDEYQIKIVQLQAAIKVKDNKIKQLQETVQTTKIKNDYLNNQENFINQQKLQVLRKKVTQYESRLITYGTRGSYEPRQYESTLVFEQRAIYELKAQNDRLKEIIAEKGKKYSSHQNILASKTNFDLIQKRLIDFNQKLQEMIEGNKNLQQKNPDFSVHLELRYQNLHFERQRTQLIRKHKNQMLAVQARLVDLQRYCSSFQNIPNNSSNISFSRNNNFMENSKGIYADQLNYYKQKNKQLEERIDRHIKLNKQLKQKLQSLLKSNGESNALQFYRLQITQMQKQTAEHLIKIKYLNNQSKNLRQQYQNLQNDNKSEVKITQLQSKIHEQNRKISQLQMQNVILQSDSNKYMQQLRNISEQIQKHKTANIDGDQKLIIFQQSIRQANNKINSYQLQIVKLNNQIKLLQAENQRINQKFTNKQGQEIGENSKLRARIVQIQNQLHQYQQNSNEWAESKASYELTIASLNLKVSNLKNELLKLNTLYENVNKKTKQADAEYFAIKSQYQNEKSKTNELEILLNQKQLEIENMNQFLERMQQFKQLRRKQRDNEGNQSKQRLNYINQMEVSIKSLKIQITQYKGQLQKYKIQNTKIRQSISNGLKFSTQTFTLL